MTAAIQEPVADITVTQSDNGLEVHNGNMRLNLQLKLHGSAFVRVIDTGEQFAVRRDVDGNIVRA